MDFTGHEKTRHQECHHSKSRPHSTHEEMLKQMQLKLVKIDAKITFPFQNPWKIRGKKQQRHEELGKNHRPTWQQPLLYDLVGG